MQPSMPQNRHCIIEHTSFTNILRYRSALQSNITIVMFPIDFH